MPLLKTVGKVVGAPINFVMKPLRKPMGYVMRPLGKVLNHPWVKVGRGLSIASGSALGLAAGVTTMNPLLALPSLFGLFSGGRMLADAYEPMVEKRVYDAKLKALAADNAKMRGRAKALAVLAPLLGVGGYYLGKHKDKDVRR